MTNSAIEVPVLDEVPVEQAGDHVEILAPPKHQPASSGVIWLSLTVFLPAAICFFIGNITNGTLLPWMALHHLMYASNAALGASSEKTVVFLLSPFKSALYFFASACLLVPVGLRVRSRLASFLSRKDYLQTIGSMAAALALTATIFPLSFGRSYARISTDPFNQDVGQLYRRLLEPALAYLYHLDGFLFILVAWGFVFLAALLVKAYLKSKFIFPSSLEEVSFLTVGIFASSYQCPGYSEILVLSFALVALFEFEEHGKFTNPCLMCFALSLMAHESVAVLIFIPMLLVYFGRPSWHKAGAMMGIYLFSLFANFGFHAEIPFRVQAMISDVPANFYFHHYPTRVVAAWLLAFKGIWVLVAVGLWQMWKRDRRSMWFCMLTIAFATASTYIAVDYTRMIELATLGVLVCLVSARKYLWPPLFTGIVALNLLVPSFYMGGNSGLITFRGLYYQVYRHVLPLPPPEQTNSGTR
jgi:hypothetical protein